MTMATKISVKKGKEFTFDEPSKRGQESKYPWAEWFNGDILLLEQSVGASDDDYDKWGTLTGTIAEKKDFEASMSAMMYKIKQAARRLYKVVQTRRKDVDGKHMPYGIIIKARDMSDEERAAEDRQRVIDKAEKLAKLKAKANGNGASEVNDEEAE
jgi:hypothetical protein